jgi:hypothetical protein
MVGICVNHNLFCIPMDSISALRNQIRVTRGLLEQAENKLALMKINTGNPDNELILNEEEKEELNERKKNNRLVILKKIYKDNTVSYMFRYNNEIKRFDALVRDYNTDIPIRVVHAPDYLRMLRIYDENSDKYARFTILDSADEDEDYKNVDDIMRKQFLKAELIYIAWITWHRSEKTKMKEHEQFEKSHGVDMDLTTSFDYFFIGLLGRVKFIYHDHTFEYYHQYEYYSSVYKGLEYSSWEDSKRVKRLEEEED